MDPDGDGIQGIREKDYPVRTQVPEIPFSCEGLVDGGLYGDPGPESRCQVFHRCDNDGNSGLMKSSFLCPNKTMFDKKAGLCDWWFKADCKMEKPRTGRSTGGYLVN